MTFSFLQSASSTSDLTTYTWSTQNLGTAASDRYIIVGVISRQVGTVTPTISSATIGGVSATIVRINNSGTTNLNTQALIIANVPTGTTGDVVVTFGSGQVRAAIGMYRATGIASATPTDQGDSDAAAPTYAIDVTAGGFAIGIAYSGTATATTTWTNLTENFDANLESAVTYTGASKEFATTQTNLSLTATFTVTNEDGGVFASWAPATAKVTPARHIFRR